MLQNITTVLGTIAGNNNTTPSPVTVGDVTLGGVLSLNSVQLSFSNLTIVGGAVTAGTITLTTGAASLNLGGAVTIAIDSVSGTYNIATKTFSLTLGAGKSDSISMAFSSFVNITAASASLTYNASNTTTVTLSNNSTDAVSVLTIGINNATIFAGLNGPASNSGATGVELSSASLALVLMGASDGTTYYGMKTTAGALTAVGLPAGFTMSATNLEVDINGSTNNNGANVVNFNTSFGVGTGLAVSTGGGSINLDYKQPIIAASGTIELDFNSFVYINGSLAITSAPDTSVYLNNGTTTATTPTSVSELLIGADDVTIFVGVNGPSTNSSATGVELSGAGLALAIFKPATGTDIYYGLQATAASLSGVGLPNDITVSGTDINVAINGNSNASGPVVDFVASFGANGLAVPTGTNTSVNLAFTSAVVQVAAEVTFDIGTYIQISGGFSFTKNNTEIDIEVGTTAFTNAQALSFSIGSFVTATGSLSMVIDANNITINQATLSDSGTFAIGSILTADTPTVIISNFVINRVTGALTGDNNGDPTIEVTAVGASLFPGNSSVTATISTTNSNPGLDATFDLVTNAFSLNVQQFTMVVGSLLTASASGFSITYNPTDTDPHQQLMQIGTGTITFNAFNNISVGLTGLTVYKDGFYFDSVSISEGNANSPYTFQLGSLLSITNPTIILTNFAVTFGSSVSAGSITLSATNVMLNIAGITATAENPSITVNLAPGSSFGALTFTADSLDLTLGPYVSIQTTSISLNTSPSQQDDTTAQGTDPIAAAEYLVVGSATVTVTLGSALTLSGTATNFSVINTSGGPALHEDNNFGVSITATPGQLNLPSWLGFQIQKFEIIWTGNTFVDDPAGFTVILSANINSIQGLPDGVTVSGSITDAVISFDKLEQGQFPITSVGSIGGGVTGNLFGMEVNASFILGIVNFNAQGQIINADGTVTQLTPLDGSLTETLVPNGDTTVKNSVLYVGVSGGATIPGVGGVQIYIGFSSLGPLTVYMSAEFPLILDPDTGIAIGGFSGGITFDYSIPTPSQPQDLASISLSPSGLTLSQWQQQLRDQTVTQYTAGSGGTNLSAEYSQPFVIEAGVTLYDAYASADSFTITGTIAIQIDPAQPNETKIFMEGTATFGGSLNFNAYLYLNVTVDQQTNLPTVTVMFLVQAPATIPVESFGGSLMFGFTDAQGHPLTTNPTTTATNYSEWIPLSTVYNSAGTVSITNLPVGSYVWTPGANDFSLTVGNTIYLATSGPVVVTTTSPGAVTFAGTPNTTMTGTLGSVLSSGSQLPSGAQYITTTFNAPPPAGGFYLSITGFLEYQVPGDSSINVSITGAITLTVTASQATIDLWGDLNVSFLGEIAVAQGEFVINYDNSSTPEFYGALLVKSGAGLAALQAYGLTVTGALLFQINTTGTDQTVNLPNAPPASGPPPTGLVAPLSVNPFTIQGSIIFDLTILGTTGAYATLDYSVGGTTLFDLQGYFDLRLTYDATAGLGLQIFAVIHQLSIGSSDTTAGSGASSSSTTPLISFTGFGLFVVNSNGFAAEMDLTLTTANIPGFSLTGNFTLVLNTTGQEVIYTIPTTATLPPASGGPGEGSGSLGASSVPGVTVYGANNNPLPNLATIVDIPAGLPQGSLTETGPDANGHYTATFAASGVADPYIVIAGDGTLTLTGLSTLTLTGSFNFELSYNSTDGLLISLLVSMNADLSGVSGAGGAGISGSLAVTGAIQIASGGPDQGLVALLSVGGGTTQTTDYGNYSGGSGVELTANFQLGINTTSADITSIGGVALKDSTGGTLTLTAKSFEMLGTGTLAIDIGGTGFLITGSIFASGSASVGFTISVDGVLTATVGGATLLTMNASGTLTVTSGGSVYGALQLTVSGNNPLSGSGFSFGGNGEFDLELNTDPSLTPSVMVGGNTFNLAAGPYVEVHANGSLFFGTSTNGFQIQNTNFYLVLSTNGLAVSASGNLAIVINNTTLFSINGSAAMLISSAGFAASLTVTTAVTDPNGNYAFSGTFNLQVNTTGQPVVIPNGPTISASPGYAGSTAGPYFLLHINGVMALGGTSTTTSTGLLMTGDFYLTISAGGLAVTASASLGLVVGGTNIFTLNASGALLINSSGIAAKITLTSGSNLTVTSSNSLFSYSLNFLLEINTTGAAVTTINNQTVNLPSGTYFEIAASGSLTLGGLVTLNGSFTFILSGTSVTISMDAHLNVMGVIFTAVVNAGIYSDGIALDIDLTVGNSSGNQTVTVIPGVLTLIGTFELQINTSHSNHFGISGVSGGNTINFNIAVSAAFNLFGFTLASTSFSISDVGGVFSASGQVGFNFFGFATITLDFYFDSHGNYAFYGTAGGRLGSSSFNISGSITVTIANISYSWSDGNSVSSGFSLSLSISITAFGLTFGGITATVSINGSSVDLYVTLSINTYIFGTIHKTFHMHLGTLNVIQQPLPDLGSVIGGVLTLNTVESGDEYEITQNANGSITLYDPSISTQTETLSGAGSININLGGYSNSTVVIDSSVTLPVTITSGGGVNSFNLGSGPTTITGTSGNDTVIGGSGNVTFNAGSGTSVFQGGGTGSTHNIINDPGSVTVIEGGYSGYSLVGSSATSATLTYGGNTDQLNGSSITVALTGVASGAQTFSVSNYSGTATLDENGNTSVVTSIETDNGNLSLSGNVITESNGLTGTITLQSTVGATTYVYGGPLNLTGGSGNNTFTVNSWSGSGAVNLNGMGGSDTYLINFQGSGSFTANVNDSGATGTDALTINGTTGNDTINLSGSAVSLGSQTVNYSGIENLAVYTKTGNDTVNVTGTSAITSINAGNGNDVINLRSISNPTTINLGAGTNTVNVGTNAPTETGGTLNNIQALLTVTGGNGGTDTLYLDDSADNSAATATLTATSLTGVFGSGGSLNYSGIATFNLYLGNGNHTVNVQGMNGIVNIALGNGANLLNIGSNAGPMVTDPISGNATNTGSVLTQIVGTLNFTGTGSNTVNVDDSGSNQAVDGAMTPTSIEFLNLVTINLPNVVAINISLSQAGDLFAVANTFTSSSPSPVIVIDGNGGDDTFIVTDTHAEMIINGGDGGDTFYNFGNSSVLYLNGDAGDDDFYIYASVSTSTSTSNVDPGGADSNGNTVYSYRVNAPVFIDGGTGNDKLFIFGTVLNDVITINGTQVTGAGIDVTFTDIEQLTIEGLGGNDTFYIESITVPTTIVGDGSLITVSPADLAALASLGVTLPNLNGNAPPATSFNDTFYVGWQGASYIPGSLAGITAPLTIEGDNGPNADGTTTNTPGTDDTIYVDDSGDTANRNFTLTANTLTSNAFGVGGYMTYDSAVENLNLYTSTGNNLITVNGTGTATQTSIYGGPGNDTFVVNVADGGSLASPLALFGGLNTFAGDTLTVNGASAGNTFDLTGFTIDGAGATISYEQIEKLTINAGGATTFNVNGDSIPTYLNGGSGGDTFNVNSNVVPLYLAGGTGNDTFTINANSGMLTATDAAGANSFTVNGNSGTLTLSGGIDSDSFIINGNSGALTANGGAGADSFTVNALSSPATLNGGPGNDSFTVNAPLAASLTVNGGGDADDMLTVNGTVGNDFITITGSAVSGLGATINYSATNLTVNGLAGNDAFYVLSTSAATYINTGGGINVVEIGSNEPYPNSSILDGIQGAVTVNGNGSDTLNIDDSASGLAKTGTLTSSTLNGLGLGAGGITYTGIATLNLLLGSGNDTLNIQNTNAATRTYVNTGAGADTINVGSLEPMTGGTVAGIQGVLIIAGGGGDTLNADDTGNSSGETGLLTATTLTGLGMDAAGITWSGLAALNINLGSGNDTFNVLSTNSTTVTTVNTGPGTNTVNVGSLAPATGGVVGGIQGALMIVGSGSDTLNVDNTGSTTNQTGTLTVTTLTGLGMGAGGITYSGLTALNIHLGSGNDTFNITGVTNSTATTIDGGPGTNNAVLNFSGDFAGQNLTVLNFATATLYVGGNFSGLLNDPGAITAATIVGSLTNTGVLNAGSVGTMTVGGNLAGLVNVTGLLGTLTVNGGTPGEIIAGNIHVITVLAGYGNKVLQVIEGGIEREILATPVNGGAMPNTVHFAFVYDSESAVDPQLAIRITDTNPAPRSYNLALVVVNSSTAKFNLSLVDSYLNGKTGVSNISLQGDLLTQLSIPELQFFTDLTASSRAGVVLPADSITGVEVSGMLPIGFIDVAGIEGLAFAVLTTATGKPVTVSATLGSAGNPHVLWTLLGSNAALNPATDAFVIPFNETHSVTLFAHDNLNNNLQLVMTLTDAMNDNTPITAYVQMVPALAKNLSPLVESIQLIGAGGSITSSVSIDNITSTGPLGNVVINASTGATVGGAAGLGNVTAPSIFGSITVKGNIYGIIQTTGGDIGETILGQNGEITGVTTISATGTLTGQIIARGNLVSSVKINGAFSGVIAAQGDIGAIQRDANGNAVMTAKNALTRFGGISIGGNDSGQIIALGDFFGDVSVGKTMTGRIAVAGQAVAGLAAARCGILGNVTIHSFAPGSAIISGGMVGDLTGNTIVTVGDAKGFVAAKGGVNLKKSTNIAAANLLQNIQSGSNLAALNAIFTNGGSSLLFDTGGSLHGLALIETDLTHVQDNNGVLSGSIP
ncbi:MAG: hypothetical protein ACLQAH_13200 [Limisphaerales bacterium]